MFRPILAALGVAVTLTSGAGEAAAQPAPTVNVSAGPTTVSVQAPETLPAGPTRFALTRTGGEDVFVYFALLQPGAALPDLVAALRRDDRTGGDSAFGVVTLQASVALSGGESTRGVTFTLKPGLTYLVVSEANTETEGRPRDRGLTSFTTSAVANGAAAGATDATVRMSGMRFRGDRVLPRQSVVRVENNDGVPHFALAFPLRSRVRPAQFGRALLDEDERALERVLAGPPSFVQPPLSGGAANAQEVRFPRAGRYGLVCFLGEHHRLGMYRLITVR